MLQINTTTLKNGLTLITIDLPHLDSVTSMIAVGAGSRYETKRINGISHFLEHMFFKGSKKYPSAEKISTLIDGIGAVNNAGTSIEFTFYWVKSAAKHLELATDIISSMIKEPLFSQDEINREKGVIVEEKRMRRDNPQVYVWELYHNLIFGDQPLGWDLTGSEETVNGMSRGDFLSYVESLYSPKNMTLVFVGKLPKDMTKLAKKFFGNLPKRSAFSYLPFQQPKQNNIKVNIHHRKTDQANLMLGVIGYSRYDPKKYIADVLATILGAGSSSRLYMQVRERRGLAYSVSSDHEEYLDTGTFRVFAGLKLEKMAEGLRVIKTELARVTAQRVTSKELKKAKEMIRGFLALRSESTNFLAEYFGVQFVLDRKIETFAEYLKKIDAVSAEDVQKVARELFQPSRFNLQIIGPFKSPQPFVKILS